MSTEPKDPTLTRSVILEQQIDQIWERSGYRRQSENYEADVATLARYQEQAQKLKSTHLMTYVWNTAGALHNSNAQPDLALEAYQKAFESAQAGNYLRGQIVSLMNIGTAHTSKYEDEKALACNLQALELLELGAVKLGDAAHSLRLTLYSNTALFYTELGRLQEAQHYCDAFLVLFENYTGEQVDRQTLGITMLIVRGVRSSILMSHKDFAGAWVEARLAMELGQGMQSNIDIVNSYLRFAKLALHDPSHEVSPEVYWLAADTLVNNLLEKRHSALWSIASPTFLRAGQEFLHLNEREWAMRCVSKAIAIFNIMGDEVSNTVALQQLKALEQLCSVDQG